MPTSFHLVQGFTAAALIATGLTFILGCQKDDDEPTTQTIVVYVDTVTVPPGAVADVDGNIYPTTVIGTQRWMVENLRTSHYTNGDPIPYVPSAAQWAYLTTGAWSNYDNDAGYDVFHGKLYNWYTVTDPRNMCPTGWHVPTDEEWMELEQVLGVPVSDLDNTGSRGATGNAGGRLKALDLWDSPNTGASDSVGFTAYPGGVRSNNGNFTNINIKGYWWSTTENDIGLCWQRSLTHDNAGIYRLNGYKAMGASVRCVKD